MWNPFRQKTGKNHDRELLELRNALTDPNSWLHRYFGLGGGATNSGTSVNEESALGIGAVYSCVRLIAWTIASLPIHTFKRLTPKGKERDPDHPVYLLLHDEPNPEQTPFEFKSLMSTQQLLWGAGVAEIERDEKGVPIALWPIPTRCVTPKRTPKTQQLIYEINAGSTIYRPGQTPEISYIWPENMIIFPALTSTRDCWRSPISTHRETLGYSIALQEYGAKTFGQGVNPAGIISTDAPLSEAAEKSLIASLSGYSGLSGTSRLMYLNAGVHFERIGLPPQDAEYVQNRRLSIADVSRIYQTPLFLLNEQSTVWGSGLEEINASFFCYTLNPYLRQMEQEYTKKLISSKVPGKRKDHFVEFNADELLRGKLLDRYQAYLLGRQATILSPDECRDKENLNPLPNGEGQRYDTPMNMVNVDIADKVAQSKQQQPQSGQGGKQAQDSNKNGINP